MNNKLKFYYMKSKKLFIFKMFFKLFGNSVLKKLIPSFLWLKVEYFINLNRNLNIINPKTYNEKLQWLKLYDRKPIYTQLVDKFEVRKYIKNIIGENYLIPLIGVWNEFDEINFEKLPNQFVLKPTHTSGNVFICKDKTSINLVNLKREINGWLKRNYFWEHREWPYKNVKPRIICEILLEQKDGDELRDYRFFCFNGEPKFITVDFSITDKKKTRRNIYDLDWNLLDVEISYPKEKKIVVVKPNKLEEMISLSRRLSANIPHSRIDFYYIENKVIFGEITFYHQSGMGKIYPTEFDLIMGSWIQLPEKYRK